MANLGLGVVANASENMLVKIAMMPPCKFSSLTDSLGTSSKLLIWLGLGLYGGALLLYAAGLARLPLNTIHPILTLAMVLAVALLSVATFRESFHWTTLAGIVQAISSITPITSRAE